MTFALPRSAQWVVGLGALIACIVYAQAVHGPFVHDDWPNLYPVLGWFAHQETLANVLWGNDSGLLGRPIAMLSFMLNARLFGFEPVAFKSINIALHALCGGLIYLLIAEFRRQFEGPSRSIVGLPLEVWVALLWLLSPMHASTVLYTVQRMTQLSAVFVLLGLWTYLRARKAYLVADTPRQVRTLWLLGLPACLAMACLSKENGALLPAFWLLFELSLGAEALRRSGLFRALFALCLLLPTVAVALYLAATQGGFILQGYAARDFDLWGRMLSQVPILLDYVYRTLNPLAPRVFLFGDGFFPTGLSWRDPTFWCSLAVWALLLILAWRVQRRAPLVLLGLAFFLVAHAIESSIFALDLYYEHRNYLAALGLVIALVGALELLPRSLGRGRDLVSGAFVVAFALAELVALDNAVKAWSSQHDLASYGVDKWPDSVRAQVMLSNALSAQGETNVAITGLRRYLDGHSGPRAERSAALGIIVLACEGKQQVPVPNNVSVHLGELRISILDVQILRSLMDLALSDRCAGWDAEALRQLVEELRGRDDRLATAVGFPSFSRRRLDAAYFRYATERLHDWAQCPRAQAHWGVHYEWDAGVAAYMCAHARCDAPLMQEIESEIRQRYARKANIERPVFALFDAVCKPMEPS